jgi:hypothetical protein
LGYRLFVLAFSLLLSFLLEVSVGFVFLRDIVTASAASPPVDTVPATTSPRVAKQNGHIVHLSRAANLDRFAASIGVTTEWKGFLQESWKKLSAFLKQKLSHGGILG